MDNLSLFLAVVAGAGLALQSVVNAQLGIATESPLWTSAIVCVVGLVLLAPILIVRREPLATAALASFPWWIWTGGVIGVGFVVLSVVLTPRLGAALFLAVVVVGQLLAGLLIDHYGWFRVPEQPLTPARVAGAVLLVAGVALIRGR